MFTSPLSTRQAEIYREGTSSARRRFLLGEKRPPFELRLETLFDLEENVTDYSSISNTYVKVIGKSTLIHSYIPDHPIKLTSPAMIIKPIIDTSHFIMIDEKLAIYIICPTGKIVPIPNTTTFHQSGVHYAFINNKLLIFISTNLCTIKIFEVTPAGHSVRINLKQEWENVLPNNSCITTFQYGDQWYIAASDFIEAYFAQFDPETFNPPKFYPIATVVKLYLNKSQMILQFVYSNSTHIIWIRYDMILIIPISSLVTRTTTARTISIPMKQITQIIKTETTDLFTTKSLIPVVITKRHVVLVTYYSPSSPREVDTLIGVCLENGEIASVKNLNFINPKSIYQGPTKNTFTIIAKQGAFYVDFSDESSPTTVKSVNLLKSPAIERSEPNTYVSAAEILLSLLDSNRMTNVSKMIAKIMQSKQCTPQQMIVLQFLIDEIDILSACSRNNINTKYIPKRFIENCSVDYLQKVLYTLKMRAFSPAVESVLNPKFNENWADTPTAIRLDIKSKHFTEAIPKILAMKAEIFLPEFCMKSPMTFVSSLLQWTTTNQLLASRIIPTTFPFIVQRIGRDNLLDLLRFSFSLGDHKATSFILWALSLEHGCQTLDDEVANLIQHYRVTFPDFIMLHDSLVRAHMPKSAESIMKTIKNKSDKIGKVSETVSIEDLSHIKVDEVVSQLEDVLQSVMKCTQKAGGDARIIERENLVEIPDFQPSSQCSICGRKSGRGNVYSFPCGHSFDEMCLIKQMEDVLEGEELSRMKYLVKNGVDREELEEILSQDCPLCGLLATNLINKPLSWKSYNFEI